MPTRKKRRIRDFAVPIGQGPLSKFRHTPTKDAPTVLQKILKGKGVEKKRTKFLGIF
jgi:hypothetical protein